MEMNHLQRVIARQDESDQFIFSKFEENDDFLFIGGMKGIML